MRSSLITIIILLAIGVINAQPSFTKQYIQYASSPLEEAGADFIDYDGDGMLDVLMGFESRQTFLHGKNVQNTISLQILADTVQGYSYVKSADVNQDGFEDYLVGINPHNTFNWHLYLYTNDGNHNFTSSFVINTADRIERMEVADLEGDGDLDLVIDVLGNKNYFHKLTNNGNGTFTNQNISFSGQPSQLYGVADMDGDGLLDVVGVYYDFGASDNVVVVVETDTNLSPPYIIHHLDTLNNRREGVVANFHGSSLPEILLSPDYVQGVSNTQARYYQNNGNFNFAAPTFPTVPGNCKIYLSNDYDGDGNKDALASGSGGALHLIKNTGNGSFNTSVLIPNTSKVPISWRDFDNDGQNDLLLKSKDEIEVFLQQQNGSYQNFWNNHLVGGNALQVFDADNNNTLDIMGFESNNIYSTHQTFDGKFLNSQVYVPAGLPSGLGTIRGAFHTDYDNDGDLDILASYDYGALHWLININGTFSASANVGSSADIYFFEQADLDGDANTDYIGFGEDNIWWLEWNGTSFNVTSIGAAVQTGAVHDVDGDGDLDIPYLRFSGGSSFGSGKLTYATNDGSGSFSHTVIASFPGEFTSSFNSSPSSFKKVDLDKDGDMDYLVLSFPQNKILWLRNDGSGFTAVTITTTVNGPKNLIINDFDQDGDIDFLVNSFADFEVVLFTNNGSQQFTGSILVEDIAVDQMDKSDLDQDGDQDVVLASRQQDTYLWLKNDAINCPRQFTSFNDSICATDSILVNGNYYSAPATLMDTLTGMQGCDSINTLNLFSYAPNIGSTQQDSICRGDSVLFANEYRFIPGVYHDTLSGLNSCDSVHSLNLFYYQKTTLSLQRDTNDLYVNAGFSNYQWYFNGNALSGETGDSLNGHQYGNGSYFLLFEDANGCLSSTDTINFIIDDVSLVESYLNKVHLYPNPAGKVARLYLGNLIQHLQEIQLHSTDGKLVSNDLWQFKQEGEELILDLSSLPKGVFLLTITVEGNQIRKRITHF